MIRKLILPALTVALLVGCVTGYSYRQGSGDYYYGAPSVEYRYYPTYPYGAYGYYGPYRYVDPHSYRYRGYPNGYYGGYGYPYGYPYSNYYHYRRPGRQYPPIDPTPDGDTSPWRRLDETRRGRQGNTAPPPPVSPPPPPQPRVSPTRTPRSGRLERAQERELGREEGR